MSSHHADDVKALTLSLADWGRERVDVEAIALVGSWASGRPRPDSDVDVVVLSREPSAYIESDDWLSSLGGIRMVHTRTWGPITERRFVRASGLEVELGVGTSAWASVEPLDEGTRQVVCDGMRIIYDPRQLLAGLQKVCATSSSRADVGRL